MSEQMMRENVHIHVENLHSHVRVQRSFKLRSGAVHNHLRTGTAQKFLRLVDVFNCV